MDACSSARTSACASGGRLRIVAAMYRSVRLVRVMSGLRIGQVGDRAGEREPVSGQGVGETDACGRRAIELAGPGLVGVPLAGEEPLLLQPAEEGIERVGVGREPAPVELLEEAVPVAGCHEQ